MSRLVAWGFAAVAIAAAAAGALWASLFLPPGPVDDVRFRAADGVELKGRYYAPGGEGEHPGLVLLHGSGPQKGSAPAFTMHAVAFARAGFGVLVYDKRGAGASGGDFDTATLEDFAADGLAGVRYLRARADVRDSGVGLFGSSEGGWLTPVIAVEDGAIAFIVNRVGPVAPWGEVFLFEHANRLRALGIPEASIKSAVDLRRDIWAYYRRATDGGAALEEERTALEARISSASGEAWFAAWPPRLAPFDADAYRDLVSDIDFDPRPALATMHTPLLAVFAGRDANVPTELSIRELEEIGRRRTGEIEIMLYPDLDHAMFRPIDILWGGYPRDYLPRITRWAREKAAAG